MESMGIGIVWARGKGRAGFRVDGCSILGGGWVVGLMRLGFIVLEELELGEELGNLRGPLG